MGAGNIFLALRAQVRLYPLQNTNDLCIMVCYSNALLIEHFLFGALKKTETRTTHLAMHKN